MCQPQPLRQGGGVRHVAAVDRPLDVVRQGERLHDLRRPLRRLVERRRLDQLLTAAASHFHERLTPGLRQQISRERYGIYRKDDVGARAPNREQI